MAAICKIIIVDVNHFKHLLLLGRRKYKSRVREIRMQEGVVKKSCLWDWLHDSQLLHLHRCYSHRFLMCIFVFFSGKSIPEGAEFEADGGFYVQRAEETRIWRRFPLAFTIHRLNDPLFTTMFTWFLLWMCASTKHITHTKRTVSTGLTLVRSGHCVPVVLFVPQITLSSFD